MKRRIWIKRKDRVRQRYWVGRKLKRNYGTLKLGKNIPLQLHTGTTDLKDIQPIQELFPMKPGGGLWTSTYTPNREQESDWGEFGARWSDKGILLKPIKTARIFQIDSKQDIKDLYNKYGTIEKHAISIHPAINWKKVAEDYDGVRATRKASAILHPAFSVDLSEEVKTKFPREFENMVNIWGRVPTGILSGDLSSWDTESTIWFKDVFKKKKPIILKEQNPEDWEENYGETQNL